MGKPFQFNFFTCCLNVPRWLSVHVSHSAEIWMQYMCKIRSEVTLRVIKIYINGNNLTQNLWAISPPANERSTNYVTIGLLLTQIKRLKHASRPLNWWVDQASALIASGSCPLRLFSTFFTFLRAIFFRLFRLSLAPTIFPWVSKDGITPIAKVNIKIWKDLPLQE